MEAPPPAWIEEPMLSALPGDPWTYAYLATVLLAAGLAKGLAGLGLPVIAIPFMSLAVDFHLAVALMPVSLIVSNVWQVASSRERGWAATAYWPVAAAIPVGTAIGVFSLATVDEAAVKAVIGVCVVAFVLFNVARPSWRLSPRDARWVGPLAGFSGGILGGLAAIFAPPIVVFLLSVGLTKDRFVAAVGVLYCVGSLSLAVFLTAFAVMTPGLWLWSALAFLPVLLGQALGGAARRFVSEALFRRIVLFLMLVAGANMIRAAI